MMTNLHSRPPTRLGNSGGSPGKAPKDPQKVLQITHRSDDGCHHSHVFCSLYKSDTKKCAPLLGRLHMRAILYGKSMWFVTSEDHAEETDYENERLAAVLERSGPFRMETTIWFMICVREPLREGMRRRIDTIGARIGTSILCGNSYSLRIMFILCLLKRPNKMILWCAFVKFRKMCFCECNSFTKHDKMMLIMSNCV